MATRPAAATATPASSSPWSSAPFPTLVGLLAFVVTAGLAAETVKTLLAFRFSFGLFTAGSPDLNFLSVNAVDNLLHLAGALAGAAIAFGPAGRAIGGGAGRRRTS